MIQRIQTLYLFAVGVLQTVMMFSRLATVVEYSLGGQSDVRILDVGILAALTGITALTAFAIIFLYRRRVLQARCTLFNLIVLFALQALVVYYLFGFSDQYVMVIYSIPDAFPFVSCVLSVLAIHHIFKDEFGVRTFNRLR